MICLWRFAKISCETEKFNLVIETVMSYTIMFVWTVFQICLWKVLFVDNHHSIPSDNKDALSAITIFSVTKSVSNKDFSIH